MKKTIKAWIALDKKGNPVEWLGYGKPKSVQYEVGATKNSLNSPNEQVAVPCVITYEAPKKPPVR